jgi:hypothetical protein
MLQLASRLVAAQNKSHHHALESARATVVQCEQTVQHGNNMEITLLTYIMKEVQRKIHGK